MDTILERKLLTSAKDTLVCFARFSEHTVSLEMLESVARIRYSLRVFAELLQEHMYRQGPIRFMHSHMAQRFMEETRYHHNISYS